MIDVYSEVPLITVGIASYNRPHLLYRAIESVKSQTYKNLEIIVSDNGSNNPDVTGMIHEFSTHDSRVKAFIHAENRGAFFNFRFLLKEASGKYFIWLADDDYWCPTYLESLLSAQSKIDCALAYGRAEIVDIELDEQDKKVKEMPTNRDELSALTAFCRFDSDSVFYGLFKAECGQRLVWLLKDWHIPFGWKKKHPFLLYNFVSYCFIYGLLASGGYQSASNIKAIHYIGGRSDGWVHAPAGRRHFELILSYVWIHLQMTLRFIEGSIAVGSLRGAVFAPFASLWFFVRRIYVALLLRYKIKGCEHDC